MSATPVAATASQHSASARSRRLSAGHVLGPTGLVVAITVLGAALRFSTLDVQSIWLDESATIILVHRGFSSMLSHLSSSESAPPLYYILIWLWTKVFGIGALGFRSFSALAGTVTIPVMYAAGRRMSPRAGVWAAALAAVNPAMYYYSQEARAYALLILFSAAAFVLWQRALERPNGRNLALWAAMSSVALLTHYFAVFLFVPEALILARQVGVKRLRAPVGAVLLVGLALVPLAAAERASGKTSWIEAESLTSRFAESVKQLAVGTYGPLEIFSGLLVVALAVGAVALLWRAATEGEQRAARGVAIVAAGAIALPLALAATHAIDVYDGRNMIATWVPLAVLIAAGLGTARAGRVGLLLGTGICAISLAVVIGIDLTPVYQRDNWRGIAHTLSTPPSASRIVVGEQFASLPLYVYLGPLQGTTGSSVSTREIDFVALRMRRSARSPLPPVVPSTAPAGFRLAGVSRTATYAVSRFVASRPTAVSVGLLRREQGDPKADVVIQRAEALKSAPEA
ncbi:MAG TPA: glycosyltransferase family 39 protein [Solirubrobacteraceae bacterium]|jgi:4-amino-4-deoxy-L-arabinose transferase-like glycosyltransferase|nr:glycosyltransferase family 39 protein [Solirubrobacteraceae bacterium]